MKNLENTPIGQIVANNLSTAAVFERHGFDFCCHGHQTLTEACATHPGGLNPATLVAELAALPAQAENSGTDIDPSSLSMGDLARHIIAVHHTFTRKTLPKIALHSAQVVVAHGALHPEVIEVQALFTDLRNELEQHLDKEEQILFPYIEALDEAVHQSGARPTACFTEVANPIEMMEHEHTSAGDILHRLAALTNGFTPPADACNTFRLLLSELAALERDLHRHIALENYRLFPQAIALEKNL